MLLTSVSSAITSRFREVQDVLAFIRQNESQDTVVPDPAAVIMLRGLFYVHLYGAFEFGVNRIVQGAVQVINQAQVPHHRICHPLGVLALDGAFEAVSTAGRGGQWEKRLGLIQLRVSGNAANINEGCVDLQNVWLATIKQIFSIFGIAKPAMYDVTKSGYIYELVDTRNAIAHGRESPLTKGRPKDSEQLEKLFDAIRAETFHILDCFTEYLSERQYELAS